MTLQMQEPSKVDEPTEAKDYADVFSRVIAERRAIVVRRQGADVAVVMPVEYLEFLRDALAREEGIQIARKLDWD